MSWIFKQPDPARAGALAEALALHPVVAGILSGLESSDTDLAEAFLRPRLDHVCDPLKVARLEVAVDRIIAALDRGERIAVIGDYDVDGVTSTALLVSVLRHLGSDPGFFVPRRLEEGYGLSPAAIERVLASGPVSLFIALDCGTNANAEIASLRARGIDVIVVDHHRSKADAHPDCILVNPHVHDDPSAPWLNLCTVGLTFKVAHGLLKKLRLRGDVAAHGVLMREYLDLVALGTVADLVPLTRENRVLTHHGLRQLRATRREGVRALMKVSRIAPDSELHPVDVSFRLGPRINASGRLADAALPVQMLLSSDPDFCRRAAESLESMNRERQEIEKLVFEEAREQLSRCDGDRRGLLAHGDWHPGVVGIVAGKLARHFNRPCIVLGREGELAKGSGRSVAGISLVEVLQDCSDLLDAWGGHPMAVGITLHAARVSEFAERFNRAVTDWLHSGRVPDSTLTVSGVLKPEEISDALLDQLELLHPHGEGNPEPVFAVAGITLREPPLFFGESNFRFQIPSSQGRRLGVVAWRKADNPPPAGTPVDLALRLGWNHYNGRKYPQAELVEWRPAESLLPEPSPK